MTHTIPHFRRLALAAAGFFLVLMLTAMSALGFDEQCHRERAVPGASQSTFVEFSG